MFSRFAPKSLFVLPFIALAACAAEAPADDVEAGDTDATEDELRSGSCVSGDKIVANIYDFGDVPEFTRTSSSPFTYSPAARVVSNAGAPGCDTMSGTLKAHCRAAGFGAKDTSWGPKDENVGRLLLTVSNGGGGFLMIAPKDYVYCSGNADGALPPRIVLKKTVHVQVSPEGFDPNASPSQVDAMLGGYCNAGTFDRSTFQCVARSGLNIDVASYIKTPVVGGACALADGAPSDGIACHEALTCQNGKWTDTSCATRASSSRSFCSRKGICASSAATPAEDAPCSNPPGTPSYSVGCAKQLTAGAPIELTCQDGFWTKQSCASRASSSRSACSEAGYCESIGH